jgi:hypothetical protein
MSSPQTPSQVTAPAPKDISANPSFLDWLVERARIEPRIAERVDRVQIESSDRLANVLLKLCLLSEPDLGSLMREYCSLECFLPEMLPASQVDIADLNAEFLRAREVLPLRLSEPGVTMNRIGRFSIVAMVIWLTPYDVEAAQMRAL